MFPYCKINIFSLNFFNFFFEFPRKSENTSKSALFLRAKFARSRSNCLRNLSLSFCSSAISNSIFVIFLRALACCSSYISLSSRILSSSNSISPSLSRWSLSHTRVFAISPCLSFSWSISCSCMLLRFNVSRYHTMHIVVCVPSL